MDVARVRLGLSRNMRVHVAETFDIVKGDEVNDALKKEGRTAIWV